jgi:hypothetical protein
VGSATKSQELATNVSEPHVCLLECCWIVTSDSCELSERATMATGVAVSYAAVPATVKPARRGFASWSATRASIQPPPFLSVLCLPLPVFLRVSAVSAAVSFVSVRLPLPPSRRPLGSRSSSSRQTGKGQRTKGHTNTPQKWMLTGRLRASACVYRPCTDPLLSSLSQLIRHGRRLCLLPSGH